MTIRPKNQVTVPDRLMKKLGLDPGDRLVLVYDEEAKEVRVQSLPRSYAGALKGVYGTPEEAAEYVATELAAWDEE